MQFGTWVYITSMYQIKDSVEFSVFEFHAINVINKLKSFFFKDMCQF